LLVRYLESGRFAFVFRVSLVRKKAGYVIFPEDLKIAFQQIRAPFNVLSGIVGAVAIQLKLGKLIRLILAK